MAFFRPSSKSIRATILAWGVGEAFDASADRAAGDSGGEEGDCLDFIGSRVGDDNNTVDLLITHSLTYY